MTQTIKVEVRDKKAPEIALNGDAEMTVEAGSEFSDPGYTATDNYDGDLTDKVSVTGAVDTSKPGDYEIKYSVADSSKNEIEVKRTVHVTDTTAPQIKLSGDDFMSVKKVISTKIRDTRQQTIVTETSQTVSRYQEIR